ncbi:hypothetical protein WMY93_011243 [Mugilogobius chulae]|uniref:Uncharacterized protein n=1 Tax=Mugilogobius chulae TaxID=88201 RepID=A0AAW0P5G0_9GOBI
MSMHRSSIYQCQMLQLILHVIDAVKNGFRLCAVQTYALASDPFSCCESLCLALTFLRRSILRAQQYHFTNPVGFSVPRRFPSTDLTLRFHLKSSKSPASPDFKPLSRTTAAAP